MSEYPNLGLYTSVFQGLFWKLRDFEYCADKRELNLFGYQTLSPDLEGRRVMLAFPEVEGCNLYKSGNTCYDWKKRFISEHKIFND